MMRRLQITEGEAREVLACLEESIRVLEDAIASHLPRTPERTRRSVRVARLREIHGRITRQLKALGAFQQVLHA